MCHHCLQYAEVIVFFSVTEVTPGTGLHCEAKQCNAAEWCGLGRVDVDWPLHACLPMLGHPAAELRPIYRAGFLRLAMRL